MGMNKLSYVKKKEKKTGAELGQAQPVLGLGITGNEIDFKALFPNNVEMC